MQLTEIIITKLDVFLNCSDYNDILDEISSFIDEFIYLWFKRVSLRESPFADDVYYYHYTHSFPLLNLDVIDLCN